MSTFYDSYERFELGDIQDQDEAVVYESPDGRLAVLPESMRRRLNASQLQIVAEMQATARQINELQRQLGHLIEDARGAAISWHVIGWTADMTGEGARKRWGSGAADE